MTELFDEDKLVMDDDAGTKNGEMPPVEQVKRPMTDARRRLEDRLEEKRLRDELEDFVDYT